MTEIHKAFPEIDELDALSLSKLQDEILRGANGDWKALDDENLTRLWKITRALRKKAAHSGEKKKRTTGNGKQKKEQTLDDLI